MADFINQKPKMLSLNELAEMTAKQSNAGSKDEMVRARDLTNVDTTPLTPMIDMVLNDALEKEIRATTYTPNGFNQTLHPVQPEDIAPPAPVIVPGEALKNEWMASLDNAIERDKQQMWDDVVMPLYEKKLEEKALKEEDEEEAPSITFDDSNDHSSTLSMLDDDEENDIMEPIVNNNVVKIPDLEIITEESAVEEATWMQDMNDSTIYRKDLDPVAVPPVEIKPVAPEPIVEEIPASITLEDPSIQIPLEMPTNLDDNPKGLDHLNLEDMFEKDTSDDDTEEESGIILSEEDQKEEMAKIQKVIRSTAKPFSKMVNLSEYTVATKATTSAKVLASIGATKPVHSANWVLYNAGRPFTMTELYGQEIEKLDPAAESGLNELMRNRELYGIFYDHIVDANKPASFEAWAKTIPYDDIPNLYFGVYRSSFSHTSNLLPYQCNNPACKHSFMDHKPVGQLVKFKDEKAKERAKLILGMDPTADNLNITSKLFQVSDELCISFKTPSLYNVVFETSALPAKFREKYKDLVYYINCIENIYQIDSNSKKLIKMETKVEPGDIVKTVSNKYKTYAAILQKLSPDEYFAFPSYLKNLNPDRNGELTFEIPATVCPKCGKKVDAIPMDAISLLFTRLRLQVILAL